MSAIIAVNPSTSPPVNSSIPVTSLETFLAILIPVAVAAGAYTRQLFITKTSAEEAEAALIKVLKSQIEMQQREIYQLRNEIRILRATLDNSGSLSSRPFLRKGETNE